MRNKYSKKKKKNRLGAAEEILTIIGYKWEIAHLKLPFWSWIIGIWKILELQKTANTGYVILVFELKKNDYS